MFGETESESPRMPSPWDALARSTAPSPSPLVLSSRASTNNSTATLNGDDLVHSAGRPSPLAAPTPSPTENTRPTRYLDINVSQERSTPSPGSTSDALSLPKLTPEIEEGNVEYKLKLLNPSPARFARLVTQLKYRLLEGGGQALYEIGVSDFGDLIGLSREDLSGSLDTLDRMAGELGATVVVLKEIELPDGVGGKIVPTPIARPTNESDHEVKFTGKKQRDKEARRNRRAAALIIDPKPSKLPDLPSPPPLVLPSDQECEDLTRTVTLDQTNQGPDVPLSQPMPIITNYPYGRQPFAVHRHRATGSNSSLADQGVPSSVSSVGSFVSVDASNSTSAEDDDYVYTPSVNKSHDEDDDNDFGFSFDVEIASFNKDATNGLPSQRPKPLHFSSLTPRSAASTPSNGEPTTGLLRPTKKPIIPAPPPKEPSEKAAGKRMKRDRKRQQRKTGDQSAGPLETNAALDTEDGGQKGFLDDDGRCSEDASRTGLTNGPEQGPRVIGEALVVRKLALEEAFLDFGGFSLVDHDEGSDDEVSS